MTAVSYGGNAVLRSTETVGPKQWTLVRVPSLYSGIDQPYPYNLIIRLSLTYQVDVAVLWAECSVSRMTTSMQSLQEVYCRRGDLHDAGTACRGI